VPGRAETLAEFLGDEGNLEEGAGPIGHDRVRILLRYRPPR
jgi:hypothetical protein